MNALLLCLALAAHAAAPSSADKTYKAAAGESKEIAVTGGKVKLTGPGEMTVGAHGIQLKLGRLLLALPRLNNSRFAVRTAHAVAAVRGTEFYVEATPENTYLCVCEGDIDARAPRTRKDLKQKMAPTPVYHADKEKRHSAHLLTLQADGTLKTEDAPMRGHSDDEFPSLRAP